MLWTYVKEKVRKIRNKCSLLLLLPQLFAALVYRQLRIQLQYNEFFDKISFLYGWIQFFISHRIVVVVYYYFVYF